MNRLEELSNSPHVVLDPRWNTVALTLNSHSAQVLAAMLTREGPDTYGTRLALPDDIRDLQKRLIVCTVC